MQSINQLSTAARVRQLQQQWDQDRAEQRRVPLSQSWRGCLGLAMLLDDPDVTEAHGDLALVPNQLLKWLALRDLPADCCTGLSCCRYGTSYATKAVAQLRYGMPVLDFGQSCRETVNFNKQPFSKRLSMVGPPWELRLNRPVGDTLDAADLQQFDMLNRLSAAMTNFAYFATDANDKPWRHSWTRYRPTKGACFRSAKPASWMPRPYYAFGLSDAQRLTALLTDADHQPPLTWFDPFCRGLAEGLVLRSIEPEVYCGKVQGDRSRLHVLKSTIDQSSRLVRLPRGARVLVPSGRVLESAQPWARVLSQSYTVRPLANASELPLRLARLQKVFDSPNTLSELMSLWFHHQLIRLPSRPEIVMVPADLISETVRQFTPRELWWDTAPALPHYDWEIQAAVLPPVPLRRWDRLDLAMPGEVAINANISGLRWSDSQSLEQMCRQRYISLKHESTANSIEDSLAQQVPEHHRTELTLAIAG